MAKRKRRDDRPDVANVPHPVCTACLTSPGIVYDAGVEMCRECYDAVSTRFRLHFNSYGGWHRFYTPDNNPGFDNVVRCLEDGGT